MVQHSIIETVVKRVHEDVIGGAADTALEIVDAIDRMVEDNKSTNLDELVKEIEEAVDSILGVLPSLAPPINALHILMKQVDSAVENDAGANDLKAAIHLEAQKFKDFAEQALENVAQYGAEKIKDGDSIFMYSMSSTVWRILKRAKDQGKSIRVSVTESRPANEGLWTVDKMGRIRNPGYSGDRCSHWHHDTAGRYGDGGCRCHRLDRRNPLQSGYISFRTGGQSFRHPILCGCRYLKV